MRVSVAKFAGYGEKEHRGILGNGRSSNRAARSAHIKPYMSKDDDSDVDDLLPEYDFSKGVRGKFYQPGKTIIRMTIDEDVARYYSSSELINTALRQRIAEGRAPQ